MANTYTLIESKILTSNAASVTFTSIPQTYTDLKLLLSFRNTTGGVNSDTQIQFGYGSTPTFDTGSNYPSKVIQGTGSAVNSFTETAIDARPTGAGATANTFASAEIYIPNYTSSNYKSISRDLTGEDNATTIYQDLAAILWQNTNAITAIKIDASVYGNTILSGSSFYLYGIKNS